MATHQVQLSLQRAVRRPHGYGGLATSATVLNFFSSVVSVGLCCLGFTLANSDWVLALGLGLLGAMIGAALIGLLTVRFSASLALFAKAARQIAAGDYRLQLPHGPGSDLAHLTNGFGQMAATVADERKRLQELNSALEEKLRRRSLEAEQRSQELEQFIYTISHDLRSPTLSIQGFANLLQRNLNRKLDEQSQEHLLRILANAEAMDLLLRDLLEVSRLGRGQEARERIKTREIIASVLREFEPELKRLKVRIKTADDLPTICYSPRLLARVFRNLLDNAVKFMGEQTEPVISIGYERTPDGHRFSIADNGRGIEPEERERVFGLFARAGESHASGHGVGLAMVRRIVESHGGRVWVQSQPGVGSTFFFTTPDGEVESDAGSSD